MTLKDILNLMGDSDPINLVLDLEVSFTSTKVAKIWKQTSYIDREVKRMWVADNCLRVELW